MIRAFGHLDHSLLETSGGMGLRVVSCVVRDNIKSKEDVELFIERCLHNSQGAALVVMPALIGFYFDDFISVAMRLSKNYDNMYICFGSYMEDGKHASFIMKNGEIVLKQHQIYLSSWEREMGFARGTDLEIVDINGFKVAIVLSTDAFYPQVSRYAALRGVDLVLTPMAIRKEFFRVPLQASGMWMNTQMNLFFTVESGFKGEWNGMKFHSLSAIHAPLEITKRGTGLLAIEKTNSVTIDVSLDGLDREKARRVFDPLRQLNTDFYLREELF